MSSIYGGPIQTDYSKLIASLVAVEPAPNSHTLKINNTLDVPFIESTAITTQDLTATDSLIVFNGVIFEDGVNSSTLDVTTTGVQIDGSAQLLSGTSGGNSGQHLVVFINGVQYKIPLQLA